MWQKESNYQLKLVNQIFLFINLYSSIAWIISTYIVLYYRLESFFTSLDFPLLCFVIGCPVEGLRIYLGYSGNLGNNVLDLAGFLILTTFVELPIHLYLLLSLYDSFWRISLLVQSIQLLLLPIEILFNFIIIRRSLRERSLQFQMMYSNDNKLH